MTLLVFGRTGQVAQELQTRSETLCLSREEADLCHADRCAEAILNHRPRAVINAAAYTAVDRAENEEELATRINGDAPRAMAQACKTLDIPFIQISTDYVFSGLGQRPWRPDDIPEPKNAYGRSKLHAEQALIETAGCFAILRTSWVFSAHGSNFVKTMLRLSETCSQLNIVSDQIGGPTPAAAIANACVSIAEQLIVDPTKTGIYHFSGTPDISWFDFAQDIIAKAGRNIELAPVSTADYPTPASRPLNSRLNCRTTETVFGITRPHWAEALDHQLQILEAPK